MALFRRDYNKPGPGVDKDAPKKNAFFHFWELVGRKFFRLMTFNVIYLACLLPLVIFVYMTFYGWLYAMSGIGEGEAVVLPVLVDFMRILANFIPSFLHTPLVVLSIIFYGPLTMGLTYVLRNFVREEHAWTSDIFSRAISNFKQGLFFGLLDCFVVLMLYVNLNYQNFSTDGFDLFGIAASSGFDIFAIIIRAITIVFFVFYLFMRNYFYQMAVTVNLKVGQIIKNAATFGILGLWRNIIATLCVAAVLLIAVFLHPILELILVPTIMFAFAGFAAVYCTYPITDKYIVQPALALEGREEEERIGFDDLPPAVLPPELGGPGAGAHLEYISDEPAKPQDEPASSDEEKPSETPEKPDENA